ncbi:MAG: hypothetical protein KF718_03490 [Polyangiaceae bacterium]|nr:hypothetical protein [Polyangiaceae bacterium]
MKSMMVVLVGAALACVNCGEPNAAGDPPADSGLADSGGWAPDAGGQSDAAVGADDAKIVSFEFPAAIACEQSAQAWVEVENTGSSTWTREAEYKLGAVGDSDPLSATTRVELPDGVTVAPGEKWTFDITLVAPAQSGAQLSDWQMLREQVAWFGQSVAPTVNVDCTPKVPTPYRFDVIQQVASDYAHLLQINTWESCGEFVQRVLAALDDPAWGHVGKTAGEGQYSPPNFEHWVDGHLVTGFSHDVIWHKPSNQQVDIIINAAANSDANPAIWGPAQVGWEEIDPVHYRDNNPWLPAVPAGP